MHLLSKKGASLSLYTIAVLFLLLVCMIAVLPEAQCTVRLGAPTDLVFGSWSGSGDLQRSDTMCVYNSASQNYRVTVVGTGPGSSFRAVSGSNYLPYHVYWEDGVTGSGQVELSAGVALTGQTGADTAYVSCNGVMNSTVTVKFIASDLAAAVQGSYSNTLYMTIEPE